VGFFLLILQQIQQQQQLRRTGSAAGIWQHDSRASSCHN